MSADETSGLLRKNPYVKARSHQSETSRLSERYSSPPRSNTYSIPEFSDALTSKLGKAFSCSLNKFFCKEQQSVCLRGKTTVEPNASKGLKQGSVSLETKSFPAVCTHFFVGAPVKGDQ